MNKIGLLWSKGAEFNWAKLYGNEKVKRTSLPLCPLVKKQYEMEPLKRNLAIETTNSQLKADESAPDITLINREGDSPFQKPIEEKLVEICANVLGVDKIGVNDNLFEIGVDSILLVNGKAEKGNWKGIAL